MDWKAILENTFNMTIKSLANLLLRKSIRRFQTTVQKQEKNNCKRNKDHQ